MFVDDCRTFVIVGLAGSHSCEALKVGECEMRMCTEDCYRGLDIVEGAVVAMVTEHSLCLSAGNWCYWIHLYCRTQSG